MIKFSIFGINFFVSVGFFGIVTLMLYIDKTGLMFPTALAVVVHELGHLLALIIFKSKPESITLKVGTVGISGRFILTPRSEIFMLFAGPVFNLVLFFIFLGFHFVFKNSLLLNSAVVMLVVGGFNLLPIIGLDGGGILKLILGFRFKTSTMNIILYSVSVATISLILLLGFFILVDTKSNISLILMGLYLLLGILLSKKQKNYCKISRNIVK